MIEIPQDSDKSWLTLFYSLPRELAEKWKPAYELPRCPYEVLRTDKYDHIVCDDMFKLLVWDCYAWSAWQFFRVKDRKGNYRDIPGNWNQYAGYFPLWRLSYSIIPYIRMKFEQSGLGFQNLYNIPQGVEVPWLTYQQFSNLVCNVTDMVIAEQNWQMMLFVTPKALAMWMMEITKIDIISGFLGAGKTTLIKKLLQEALNGQKVVLIENEFGEIGIDGGFLKDAGIQITEMNSGCICCSLVGDFGAALKKVVEQYHPDRIIIEPSGVGKLSDVIAAVMNVAGDIDLDLNSFVTVADATKCKMYMKNFGEFYNNQVESANTIILSRTQGMKEEKLAQAVSMIQEKNAKAKIITTPWDELTGEQILAVMEQGHSLAEELMEEAMKLHEEEEHEHHHHHHDDDDDCCCHDHDHEHEHHHHDDDDDHEHEHHHHHHDHDDDECDCHEHHHDHDEHEHHHDHDEHGEECTCGCHDHDHHHHHHADEVFTSWGKETPRKYTKEELDEILVKLSEETEFGIILRAKGMLPAADGTWLYFDLVPGEYEIRNGAPDYTGRLCVIGSKMDTDKLEKLFKL